MKLSIWVLPAGVRQISFDGGPYVEPKDFNKTIQAYAPDVKSVHIFQESVGPFHKLEASKEFSFNMEQYHESYIRDFISSFVNAVNKIQ